MAHFLEGCPLTFSEFLGLDILVAEQAMPCGVVWCELLDDYEETISKM